MNYDRRRYDTVSTEGKLAAILDKMDALEKAFPYGIDQHIADHRTQHEAEVEAKAFIKDLKFTLAKNTILAFILLVFSATLIGFAVKWASFVKGL